MARTRKSSSSKPSDAPTSNSQEVPGDNSSSDSVEELEFVPPNTSPVHPEITAETPPPSPQTSSANPTPANSQGPGNSSPEILLPEGRRSESFPWVSFPEPVCTKLEKYISVCDAEGSEVLQAASSVAQRIVESFTPLAGDEAELDSIIRLIPGFTQLVSAEVAYAKGHAPPSAPAAFQFVILDFDVDFDDPDTPLRHMSERDLGRAVHALYRQVEYCLAKLPGNVSFPREAIQQAKSSFKKFIDELGRLPYATRTVVPICTPHCSDMAQWAREYLWRILNKEVQSAAADSSFSMSEMETPTTPQPPSESRLSNVLITQPQIPEFTELTEGNARKLAQYWRTCQGGTLEPRHSEWNPELRYSIQFHWQNQVQDESPSNSFRDKPAEWQDNTLLTLINWIEYYFSPRSSRSSLDAFRSSITKDPLVFDGVNHSNDLKKSKFFIRLARIQSQWKTLKAQGLAGEEDEKSIVEDMHRSFKIINAQNGATTLCKHKVTAHLSDSTRYRVEPYIKAIQYCVTKLVSAKLECEAIWGVCSPTFGSSSGTKRGASSSSDIPNPQRSRTFAASSSSSAPNPSGKRSGPQFICSGCGFALKKMGPDTFRCPRNNNESCATDPRRNNSSNSWAESETGKRWAKLNYAFLPKNPEITLMNAQPRKATPNSSKGALPSEEEEVAWACLSTNTSTPKIDKAHVIQFFLCSVQDGRRNNPAILDARYALLDSGAIGTSIISPTFLSYMQSIEYDIKPLNNAKIVHSAFNESINASTSYSFTIYAISENSRALIPLFITAVTAPIPIDLIVDRITIQQQNLVYHFPSHFTAGELQSTLLNSSLSETDSLTKPTPAPKQCLANLIFTDPTLQSSYQQRSVAHLNFIHDQRSDIQSSTSCPVDITVEGTQLPPSHFFPTSSILDDPLCSVEETWCYLASSLATPTSSNFSNKTPFERDGVPEIPDDKLQSIPSELLDPLPPGTEGVHLVQVSGPPELRKRLMALLIEYQDIFHSTVRAQPANLQAFHLEVDHSKWHVPANQSRCRRMDRERQTEMDRMINVLQANNIIEPCQDSYYSHAFLVPKSNGKWRMVVDFKNLNNATLNHYKWPLPNIPEMLSRIGEKTPSFFAVFDLTSGYYQAKISEESRNYTAFLTHSGIYRWLRLPMGLTGAGSHFQHCLVTQVLTDLLSSTCELYLDDCIVHAKSVDEYIGNLREVFSKSVDEYIGNLREVFSRFRNSGLTLNPSKCQLGLTQVEYVGHTIDSDGTHFTRDKIDSVLNFPKPRNKKQLKSFLGLANYFRDHIQNHSSRVEHLHRLVTPYSKSCARQQLLWDPESDAAFEDIRTAIDECPKRWFLNDHSPIFLQTDASNYGIGAYLFQRVTQPDATILEHPIGFVSKSIGKGHSNWDIPMKEGFAIFYALKKWGIPSTRS